MVIFRDAMRHKQRGVENRNKWEGERRWRETDRDREQSRREQPLAAEEMSWLGFSEVVNQEHQHVRAFKEELGKGIRSVIGPTSHPSLADMAAVRPQTP